MPAASIAKIRAAESTALSNGWTEEELIHLAGTQLGHSIAKYFKKPGTAVAYIGKGHNAADALLALKVLRDHYCWKIHYRCAFLIHQCHPITQRHIGQFAIDAPLNQRPAWQELDAPLLLIDGLLGIGARSPITGPLLELAEEIRWLRERAGAIVASIDVPSGMDADTGAAPIGTVKSDITFMVANPKQGLLSEEAATHSGALALVPVNALEVNDAESTMHLICPQSMHFGKSPRDYNTHKGTAGRVSILAGSASYTGAAVLCALGALRAGAGIVTLHVPENLATVTSAKCPAEIIISSYQRISEINDHQAHARVIGCGLGSLDEQSARDLFQWISNSDLPSVIDADALNLIAHHQQLEILKSHHIITPHPSEFQRLAPSLHQFSREDAARAFTQKHPVTLLLKGCRTIITQAGSPLYINGTGHPGMASAGQGDLLAGAIGARLAYGDQAIDAAALSSWLCGRAAELATHNLSSHLEIANQSVIASDVAQLLGAAYLDWCRSGR